MPDSRILQHPYFNPRSREGSDIPVARSSVPDDTISIHAPARGATSDRSQTEKVGNISIHAPARGATRRAGKIGLPFSYFNPRSREGSDKGLLRDCIKDLLFQSTLPRGERLPEPQSLGRPCQFQSTLPRGERRK